MLLKVCGMTRQRDADRAAQAGADMCGFIFAPRSPRYLSPEGAAMIRTGGMLRVGVFTGQNAVEIRRAADAARMDFIQLHGAQSTSCARALGAERIIRVIWPERYTSATDFQRDLDELAASCAFFLVDAGISGGGSGRACMADVVRRAVFPRPWLLAGGVSPDNAAGLLQACAPARPAGLDCNSALEDRPGCKNADKLRALATLKLL